MEWRLPESWRCAHILHSVKGEGRGGQGGRKEVNQTTADKLLGFRTVGVLHHRSGPGLPGPGLPFPGPQVYGRAPPACAGCLGRQRPHHAHGQPGGWPCVASDTQPWPRRPRLCGHGPGGRALRQRRQRGAGSARHGGRRMVLEHAAGPGVVPAGQQQPDTGAGGALPPHDRRQGVWGRLL